MLKTKKVKFVYSEASDCESIQLDGKELGWVVGRNSEWAVMWKGGRESRCGFVTLSAAKEYVEREISPTQKNQERSERAYRAILASYGQDQSVEENTIDILTDIMHMAPDYGNFDEMLETARMHFEAENEVSK